MKNLVVVVALAIFCPVLLKADLGSCVVYQAKFYLKDGTTFNACFESRGYDKGSYLDDNETNEFCNDEGVFQLLKYLQKNKRYSYSKDAFVQQKADYKKMVVFKKLETLIPQKRIKDDHYFHWQYGFVAKEDIVFVDSTEIKKMVFWSATYAKRRWLESEILVCNQELMETIAEQKYWNEIYVTVNQEDTLNFSKSPNSMLMEGYHLINYSPNNNVKELQRLARLKLSFLTSEKQRQFWEKFRKKHNITSDERMQEELKRKGYEIMERKIQKAKDWLWQRGIVAIRVNGTC